MNRLRLSAAVLLACACYQNVHAQDCGLWNVPGNTGQFFGHGFGGGHHAPIVRAPNQRPPRVARVEWDRSCRTCAIDYQSASRVSYSTSGSCSHGYCSSGSASAYRQAPQAYATPDAMQPMFSAPIHSSPQKPAPQLLVPPRPPAPQRKSLQEALPDPQMPKADATVGMLQVPTWRGW